MKKNNNQGFVATAVLYTITILLAMVIFVILRNVATTRKIVSESSNDVRDDLLTYEVKYDANGGIGTMENSLFYYEKSETLKTNTFIRDGHEFLGWSTTQLEPMQEVDESKIEFKDGEVVENLTEPNKVITLYAVWKQLFDILVKWEYVGDGDPISEFPEKDTGYHVKEIICNNDETTATWNDYTWEMSVDYNGKHSVCTLYVDDGDYTPMTDEIKICQNELEDEAAAKQYIVNGINGAYPAANRVNTSSTWANLASYIRNYLWLYRKSQTGTEGYLLSGSSSGSNTSVTDTIDFPSAYSYRPTVVLSVNNNQHAVCSVSLVEVKTNNFTFTVKNNGSGTGSCDVTWVAY